ncbi:MAG: LacI family DNA-binding transcriptional regulator [Burkholderiaceae bacterium]
MTPVSKATLSDVAAAAGVSVATVDRVLHARTGVHARTVARVHAAVGQLGYRADPAASRLARSRYFTIGFVLPAGTNSFVTMLMEHVRALTQWLDEQRATAVVQQVDVFSPQVLANHLARLRGRFDAVVVMAQDDPLVRAALDDLVDHGCVVITLVSDVPSSRRHHYVGIDNLAAGRTAASLLGRFLGPGAHGSVGVIMGSRALRDHAERLFGFDLVMRSEFASLRILPALEGRDRSSQTQTLAATLLRRNPDLVALYSVGAGNRGIAQALLEDKGRGKRRYPLVWVCHELTPHARRHLLDGVAAAVINQDAGHEVRSACRLALARLSGEHVIAAQERIRIDIFLKDNLP